MLSALVWELYDKGMCGKKFNREQNDSSNSQAFTDVDLDY